jgi:hypothetical protein
MIPLSNGSSILWQRLDLPGHEVAELRAHGDGWTLEGTALLAHMGRPCRLTYRIECDAAWQTRSVQLSGQLGAQPASLDLARGPDGEWTVDGAAAPTLAGCSDVDLGFSPSTNQLPIRRLRLAPGERAEVRAAWVRFPALTVEVLEQVYTRIGERRYLYESAGGAFRRELDVNDEGFVIDYPDFWRAVAGG